MTEELIGRHLLAHIVPLGPHWGLLLGTNKCRNRGTVQSHCSSLSIGFYMYVPGHNRFPDESSYSSAKRLVQMTSIIWFTHTRKALHTLWFIYIATCLPFFMFIYHVHIVDFKNVKIWLPYNELFDLQKENCCNSNPSYIVLSKFIRHHLFSIVHSLFEIPPK